MRRCLLISVSICICIVSLQAQVVSTPFFRNLNSAPSHNQKANIEIPINSEAADYHFQSFNDPSIFYCEKTIGSLGVNDICTLQSSDLSIVKSLAVANLSSPFFVGTFHILSVQGKLLVIHGIQTDLERPRTQIVASLTLNPKSESRIIDSVSFHLPSQQVAVLHGSRIEFYTVDELTLDFITEIESPAFGELKNLQENQVFYFLDKYVFIFNKKEQKLLSYKVTNGALGDLSTIEGVQEIFLDQKLAFIFTKDKLRTMDGENEVAVEFDRDVKGIVKASSTGVFVYSESRKEPKEAAIHYVEIFEKKGFRINIIFYCPKNLKNMYLTSKNMYLVFDNWVRIYPIVRDIQFNGEFYFDSVLSHPLVGVLNSKLHDYMVIEEQDNQLALYSNDRSEFGLECKKEKGTAVAEYIFQIKCYTMKCDNVDFSAQKFANGSCAYTKNIMITPEEEGGAFGTVLLVGLGLVAGAAITIGFGAINCFGKAAEETNVKTHSPKKKENKPFNINRGLRRPSYTPTHQSNISHHSHTNETRKFLHEGDESYPSEDMRESVQAMMKKKNTPMFETPRFTSFGGLGAAIPAPVNHNYSTHLENVNEPGEISHLTQDEEGNEDEETGDSGDKKPIKIEKLKLGDFKNIVKVDPTSFRNIGLPQNASPEKKMEKDEGAYEGKYSKFQDDAEEEDEDEDEDENENNNDDDDDENEKVKIDSGSGGDLNEGSFSK